MKEIQILILTVFLSCTSTNKLVKIEYSDEELTPFQEASKWGFLNQDREVVIRPQYDSLGFFYNGIAKVKLEEKYGLIRRDNSYLIKPKYDKVDEFHNNYSYVKRKGLSKYIDSSGKKLKNKPLQSLGCAQITIDIKGDIIRVGGYCELKTESRRKIDTNYVSVFDTTNLKADAIIDFSHNYIQIVKNNKIGITKFNYRNPQKTSIQAKDIKYDSISYSNTYEGNIKYAKIMEGSLWGVVNEQGYETVQPAYLQIITDPILIRSHLAITDGQVIYLNHKKMLVEYEPQKFGYIDIYGNEYF